MNLKCPTLTHFRWYRDTFLSLLFQQDVSTLYFWKERFLAGLPSLFADKVRNKIRNQNNEIIPYRAFTFGKLINEVVIEGLVLCNDLNLKNHLKK